MSSNMELQRQSFDQLVDDGIYSLDFDHPPAAKAFVGEIVKKVVPALGNKRGLNILDVGCGTGAWLDYLQATLVEQGCGVERLCGFDLSGRMAEVARERLSTIARPADLREGNILEEASYAFSGLHDGFDVIFIYDVIQQLPRGQQQQACDTIMAQLAPGGAALVFDNDRHSKFGRRMAIRKFLTKHFGLKLVPRYYCNASYPPLEKFQQRINADDRFETEILVRADSVKRAMVVRHLIA